MSYFNVLLNLIRILLLCRHKNILFCTNLPYPPTLNWENYLMKSVFSTWIPNSLTLIGRSRYGLTLCSMFTSRACIDIRVGDVIVKWNGLPLSFRIIRPLRRKCPRPNLRPRYGNSRRIRRIYVFASRLALYTVNV